MEKQDIWKEYGQLWKLKDKIQNKFTEWNKRLIEVESIFRKYLPSMPLPAEFEAEKTAVRNIRSAIIDILNNEMNKKLTDGWKGWHNI